MRRRATRRPRAASGVALATSGPGATNMVTPIADAMMDSVPTVFITGQVRTDLIGTDGFQEADVTGITLPVVKHSMLVTDPKYIPDYIHAAFHIAKTGRPGPVLVDIPQDLSRAEIEYTPPGGPAEPARLQAADRGQHQADPDRGEGARQLAPPGDLRRRRDHQRQRVGGVPRVLHRRPPAGDAHRDGPRRLPGPARAVARECSGMHGTRTANYAMDEADLIVCVGARFDDRITGKLSEFAPRAKFVHIDVDPAEISKNVPAHIPIVGDAKDVLAKLNREYRALKPDSSRLDDWWKQIREWQQTWPLRYEDSRDSEIKPQFMVESMYEATEGDAIITSDVGQHQMWAAQYYHFSKPRRWLNSGGLGTMGFGLPAAIGAKVACPDQPVVCISGDGSLVMNVQEFATAAAHDIPVKVFLMNNGHFGMVRQWQELFWEERYQSVEMGPSPEWPKLAEAFGWTGMQCTDKADLREAMTTALETEGPVLLDVHVTKDENCYPMIPAGAAARDMVG